MTTTEQNNVLPLQYVPWYGVHCVRYTGRPRRRMQGYVSKIRKCTGVMQARLPDLQGIRGHPVRRKLLPYGAMPRNVYSHLTVPCCLVKCQVALQSSTWKLCPRVSSYFVSGSITKLQQVDKIRIFSFEV